MASFQVTEIRERTPELETVTQFFEARWPSEAALWRAIERARARGDKVILGVGPDSINEPSRDDLAIWYKKTIEKAA